MSAVLDHLGIKLLEVGVASLAVLGPSALALVVLRQPARRRLVARLTWLTLIALVPLAILDLAPRWDALQGLKLACSPWGGLHPSEGLRPWLRAGAAAYLVGVAISLAWLALILFLGEWIVWSARPASVPMQARLGELAKGMGVRTPRLRVSGRFALPGVLGMFRPTIVLPESWDDRHEDEGVTLALLHELAHLASCDRVFTLLGRVVQAFWFPIPAMGWLIEQHKRDQEVLADGRAARQFGTARSYATRLVGLVEQEAARGTPTISVGGGLRPPRGRGGGRRAVRPHPDARPQPVPAGAVCPALVALCGALRLRPCRDFRLRGLAPGEGVGAGVAGIAAGGAGGSRGRGGPGGPDLRNPLAAPRLLRGPDGGLGRLARRPPAGAADGVLPRCAGNRRRPRLAPGPPAAGWGWMRPADRRSRDRRRQPRSRGAPLALLRGEAR
jgi:hypothetical protein